MELEGYSRPTYNKLLHSATTRSTVVWIHKQTADEVVNHTNTPKTCCGKILQVQNVEIIHMTLNTLKGQSVIIND